MLSREYEVPVLDALDRLDVIQGYDCGNGPEPCVHTFAQSGIGLLGAHWSLSSIRPFFERWGVHEAGPEATAANHALVVVTDEDEDESGRSRTIFFATLPHASDNKQEGQHE